MSKVTILINSCDLYEDAWEPCLKLFKIQWPNCSYDFVINSETKIYNGEFSEVKTICPNRKDLTWSQRFKYALEHIDSPYILFTLEDYFPLSKINAPLFEKAVGVLDNNPNVGMICLSHTERENIKTDDYEDENFYSRVINPKCMIWCRINLYRRDYLLKLLKMHETIWEFEGFASYRAKKLNYIILQQNSKNDEVFTFKVKIEDGYGISLRKWLPRNVDLFNKYNIPVNYNNLGIAKQNEFTVKSTDKRKQKSLIERLYRIKLMPRKIKKKIYKKVRNFKSKH